MGFRIDNIEKPFNSITPISKENPLPYEMTRVGFMEGSTLSDGDFHCFNELCLPYVAELGVFSKIVYFDFEGYCKIIDILTENKCDGVNICTRDAFTSLYQYFTMELRPSDIDEDTYVFWSEFYSDLTERMVQDYRKYQNSLEVSF